MNTLRHRYVWGLATILLLFLQAPLRADKSFADVAEEANDKMVKIFGSGGFQGLAAYGSGIVISSDGYILTVMSHLLDTRDLRVHLSNGLRYNNVKLLAAEPALDVAILKIDNVQNLPHFKFFEAVKSPLAEAGTSVLALTNQFEIATRNEPMSVQRGVISAYAKLMGHRGVFEAPYTGEVYFVDAITNNPGAAGGALVNRKGELVGIVGKEMRNQLTATWVNYAVPIQAKTKGLRNKQETVVSIEDMCKTVIVDQKPYTSLDVKPKIEGPSAYHGIVFVPDSLDRTPPYIDELERNSPGAKSGLKPDDLVVYVDGIQVISIKAFKEVLSGYQPGNEVVLEVQRGNKLESIKLTLEKKK